MKRRVFGAIVGIVILSRLVRACDLSIKQRNAAPLPRTTPRRTPTPVPTAVINMDYADRPQPGAHVAPPLVSSEEGRE